MEKEKKLAGISCDKHLSLPSVFIISDQKIRQMPWYLHKRDLNTVPEVN